MEGDGSDKENCMERKGMRMTRKEDGIEGRGEDKRREERRKEKEGTEGRGKDEGGEEKETKMRR